MSCKTCMDYDTAIKFEGAGYKRCPYCGENLIYARNMAWVNHVYNVLNEDLQINSGILSKETVEVDGEVLEYVRTPWSHNMPEMKLDLDVCIDKEIKMLSDYFNLKGNNANGKKTNSKQ